MATYSSSPFLPQSGASTLPVAPNQTSGSFPNNLAPNTAPTTPTYSGVGLKAAAPTVTAPTNTISSNMQAPAQTSSAPISYAMTPSEMSGGAAGIAAYNARIAAARSSQSSAPAPQAPAPTSNPFNLPVANAQSSGLNLPNNSGGQGPTTPNQMNNGVQSSSTPPPPGKQYMPDGTLQPIPGYTAPGAGTTGTTAPGGTAPTNTNVNYQPNAGLYGQLISGLSAAAQPNPQAQQYTQNITDLQNQFAQQNENIKSRPIDLSLAGGQEGLLQNLYSQQLSAQQSGLANTLAQQGQTIQGLGAAAGLAAPQAANALGTFNPSTGQYSGYGGTSGGSTASSLFNVGQNVLGPLQAGQNQVQLLQALTAGAGTSQTIQSYLQSNPNLNPTGSTLANGLNQWLQNGQFGDPKYQTLANYLTDYATKMAPILSAGGSVTNAKLALQQGLVNGQASGQDIAQVLNQLDSLARANLANFQAGATGGAPVGGSSVANVPGGTNPPATNSGNTYGNFFQVNP